MCQSSILVVGHNHVTFSMDFFLLFFSEGARVRRGRFGDGEDNAVVSESSRDLR